MNEIVLKSIPQHRIKFFFRFSKWISIALLGFIGSFLFSEYQWMFVIVGVLILVFGFWIETIRFKSSVLEITNKRVLLRVKKGLFRSFEVGLHYEQIVNCSYTKNNFLHSITNSGILYVRMNEKPEGQIVADFVPNVEIVAREINELLILSPEERKKHLARISERNEVESSEIIPVQDPIELLEKIPGIHGAKILSNELKKFIFQHEEERNHGVFETLRRKYTYVIIHGGEFRLPDAPIVHSSSERVIFPPVPFHELKGRNAISGSPGVKVHEKLRELFPGAVDDDATILVGVDE